MIYNIFCLWFSNTQSVYHASVTMHCDNKITRWLVHNPLLFTCQNSRQKLATNAHLEMGHYLKCHISCWNMVSQAWHAVTNPCLVARTFGLEIGIVRTVSVWRCCECEANSSEKFDKTTNMTPILKEADQSEFISGGPVSLVYCVW